METDEHYPENNPEFLDNIRAGSFMYYVCLLEFVLDNFRGGSINNAGLTLAYELVSIESPKTQLFHIYPLFCLFLCS